MAIEMSPRLGSTMAEKLLARHSGRDRVFAGDLIDVRADVVMANDVTGPLAIKAFEQIGMDRVFDPRRVIFVSSHFTPAKDIQTAQQATIFRGFAREQGIHYFEIGRGGIEHVVLPEQGLVVPGQVVIGGDSHSCTYGALGCYGTGMGSTDIGVAMATGEVWMRVPATIRLVYHGARQPWVSAKDIILQTIGTIGVDGARNMVMEFAGEAISALTIEGRMTMANMAIEAGADAGLFAVDEKTLAYVEPRAQWPYGGRGTAIPTRPMPQPTISTSRRWSRWSPAHSSRAMSRPVSRVERDPIDQVFIGSCTNNRIEDLRVVAEILRGRTIHPDIRCIIIPGSMEVERQALREGLLEIFLDGERGRLHAGLRPVPGRINGRARPWRALRLDQQSQLPRADGAS